MSRLQRQAKQSRGNCRFDVRLVEISRLKGHEELDPQRLINLQAEIKADGILKKPIAVDINTNVVLDGHHRMGVLKLLGCSKIPVLLVDYQSAMVGVRTTDRREEYSKSKVIEAAMTRKLLSPKSTWHYISLSKQIAHISEMQRRVDMPFNVLQ